MAKYIATSKNKIITANTIHQSDGYSSITMTNIGECPALINDNIPVAAGDSWEFINRPEVSIAEPTNVRFTGVEVDKRILVEMIYNKEY